MTWEAASAGAALTGSTNNTIVTVTGADAMAGETELTYTGGQLTINNDGGVAILNIDASSGQSQVKHINAGTTKWEVGIDGDGSGNQKSHVDDFAFYSSGGYGVVISGEGTNKFGIGTQAGIALSSAEIPADGIQFPATAALSASANNLDDYQEGVFTPVFQDWSFSNSEGQSYTTQVGRYVKIGRWVTVQIYLNCNLASSTLADGSQALIAGLPFASSTGTGFNYALSCSYLYGMSGSSPYPVGRNVTGMVNANTSYVVLHFWAHWTGVQPLNFSMIDDNALSLVLTGQYETDA